MQPLWLKAFRRENYVWSRFTTPLGEPRSIYVDDEAFERVAVSLKERQLQKWNKKHNAKYVLA